MKPLLRRALALGVSCFLAGCALGRFAWPNDRVSRLMLEANVNLPALPSSPTWRVDQVPQILHFVVPSDKKRWHAIWPLCMESWRRCFPQHLVLTWDDDDIIAFVNATYPQFNELFKSYTLDVMRSDVVRYLLLHAHGGIYADADYQCVKPFTLPRGKASVALSPRRKEVVQNALMASPASHPFWVFVMREVLSNAWSDNVFFATGPRVVAFAMVKAPHGMFNGLPNNQFSRWPTSRRLDMFGVQQDAVQLYKGKDTYAIHLGTCWWCTADAGFKINAAIPS